MFLTQSYNCSKFLLKGVINNKKKKNNFIYFEMIIRKE